MREETFSLHTSKGIIYTSRDESERSKYMRNIVKTVFLLATCWLVVLFFLLFSFFGKITKRRRREIWEKQSDDKYMNVRTLARLSSHKSVSTAAKESQNNREPGTFLFPITFTYTHTVYTYIFVQYLRFNARQRERRSSNT